MQIFAPISPLFNIGLSCAFFLIKSAPSRLTPNEALPQTPQGTLSLDPASPLTPGLSLRFTSRSARCWISHYGQLCQFLIPHSSFFILHSYLFSPQHQYPDNIRHCHKSIENIRHSPHKLHAPHRSNAPTSYRHDPIDHIISREKVSPSPLSNEKPPCHCR